MGFESGKKGSVHVFAKDYGKKKRTNNRLAKLKQCKLDARREQWLSQAKNKESVDGSVSPRHVISEENGQMENSEIGSRGEENDGSSIHESDLESLANCSVSTDSRKDRPRSSCGSSSVSSSIGCYSGNFSDEEQEEEEDECVDDWETVADALTADEKQHSKDSEPLSEQVTHVEPPEAQPKVVNKTIGVDVSKPVDIPKSECKNLTPQPAPDNRAWKRDDAFRPQSLPNLSKQYSFTKNAGRHLVHGSDICIRNNAVSLPSSCPICYEDLDVTDSSFQPCICGFKLCLFCHNRIFEVGDGRCPGCRRPYDPIDPNGVVIGIEQSFQLARSCSISQRSLGKSYH
ncbi:hypothetical protein IFM89_000766 [Coptis chinensis]|uniref:RING-type domain-containing protein n=1 Tax=Coptis chinensis TaxID=261450 RepID=A0A835IV77_9MAGN|nr:hypothetical protein IFM89_000766 [Coptis chinensis]